MAQPSRVSSGVVDSAWSVNLFRTASSCGFNKNFIGTDDILTFKNERCRVCLLF